MGIKITNDREEAVKVGYVATDWNYWLSFEDYVKKLENWKVRALAHDDEVIGAIYQKGDELHVSVLKPWRKRWLTKPVYRELFVGKRVTTKVTPGHDFMYGILERLGFKLANDGFLVKE